jgi:hypothetical protein
MPSTVRRCLVALFALTTVGVACSRPGPGVGAAPAAHYDPATGRLRQFAFDSTGDGHRDAIGIMDGVLVQRIDVDEDRDGVVDRWEFYDGNRRLGKVGFSRHRDGVMDAVAHYGSDGTVARVEISSGAGGAVGRVEHYLGGLLVRVEEDTNADGRVDKWETYALVPGTRPGQPPSLVSVAFDDHFRGEATRRLHYDAHGNVLRVEVTSEDAAFPEQMEDRRP